MKKLSRVTAEPLFFNRCVCHLAVDRNDLIFERSGRHGRFDYLPNLLTQHCLSDRRLCRDLVFAEVVEDIEEKIEDDIDNQD